MFDFSMYWGIRWAVCIYDKFFLARGTHFFSYEFFFYSSSYALLSLFYKNYIFNRKLFYFYNYCGADFFSSFKIFRRKGKLRFGWLGSRYRFFSSSKTYTPHLLEGGSYVKKIRSSYKVKLLKPTTTFDRAYSMQSLAGITSVVFSDKYKSLKPFTKKYVLVGRTQLRYTRYVRRKQRRLHTLLDLLKSKLGKRRRRSKSLFFLKFGAFYKFNRQSVIKWTTKSIWKRKPRKISASNKYYYYYSRKTRFQSQVYTKKLRRLSAKHVFYKRTFCLKAKGTLLTLGKNGFGLYNAGICKTKSNSRSFRKYRSWSIQPTQLNSFILYYVGLLILPKLNFKLRLGSRPISIIRRKLYSFIKPNELRLRAFSARRRLLSVKLLRRLSRANTFHKRLFSHNYVFNFFKTTQSRDLTSTNPLFRLSPLTKLNMYYREHFFNFYQSSPTRSRVFHRDVSVERVRFKPGYQRLWRRFRLALAESLAHTYTYQQQLTKYLVKFSRKISQRSYTVKENTLRNVMLYSRLIPDLAVFEVLLSNSTIFLNHRLIKNHQIFIYRNDFIQCEVTVWFYIFSKWVMLWVRSRNAKFRRLVYKKSLAGRYKIMKQRKQKSRYTPKWIFLVDFDFIDVKPFLEVDYLTLSFFVVYDFKFFYFYRPEVFTENKLNIYRLYNWKYIN